MASLSDGDVAARPLTVMRGRPLRGRFKVAPAAGHFALAVFLAALARGESVLYRDAGQPDAELTAIRRLLDATGIRVHVTEDRWEINGLGMLGLLEPEKAVDLSGAEKSLPPVLALLGSFGFPSRLIGESRHGAPSLTPVVQILKSIGIVIEEQRSGRLPLTVRAPRTAMPFAVRLEGSTPAAKAALLLAALGLPGISSIREASPSPDHAERLLRHFGATVLETTGVDGSRTLAVTGLPTLGARTLALAGDPDLAALPLLAALIVPDSDVRIENVPMHPGRVVVLSTLEEMGGDISVLDRRLAGGEEVADLRVRHSPLLGVTVDARQLTLDAVAVLAVAGAFAAGETRLPRLGLKGEGELHAALAATLSANGATARADATGLHVGRPAAGRRLGGESVRTGDDPHLAAALLVFGLAAAEQVTLEDMAALSMAFPDLIDGLEGLGAEFYWREAA